MKERLLSIIYNKSLSPLKIYLGLYSMVWGLALLAPWADSFSVAAYRIMAAIAPEWAWGWFIVTIGAYQVVAVILNLRKHRQIAGQISAVLWVSISWFLVAGPFGLAALGTYHFILAALGNLWVVLRWSYWFAGKIDAS